MSNRDQKICIIGGGFSGLVAALSMRREGLDVEVVERSEAWRADGTGIGFGGSAMRLLDQIGVMEEFLKTGTAFDGMHVRGPDDAIMVDIPTPGLGGPDVPGMGGIMRPTMIEILSRMALDAGVKARLGTSYTDIDPDTGTVHFTDDTVATYDLVVAADGLWSKTRDSFFPEASKPQHLGQVIWRAVIERPLHIPTMTMWMAPNLKVGINHISATSSYIFLTENRAQGDMPEAKHYVTDLKALLANFASPTVVKIASEIDDDTSIDVRAAEQLLLPAPWYKGRLVLIGDAVHATTPHLASGALIGMEDGVVLAQEIVKDGALEDRLAAFLDRRFERCRMVVENSGRLAEIEVQNGDRSEHAALMKTSLMEIAKPI